MIPLICICAKRISNIWCQSQRTSNTNFFISSNSEVRFFVDSKTCINFIPTEQVSINDQSIHTICMTCHNWERHSRTIGQFILFINRAKTIILVDSQNVIIIFCPRCNFHSNSCFVTDTYVLCRWCNYNITNAIHIHCETYSIRYTMRCLVFSIHLISCSRRRRNFMSTSSSFSSI